MMSAKHTAIYAQEVKASKDRDDLVFISYDFIRIAKKIILENDDCVNGIFDLDYNGFKMKIDALCENDIVLIDIFNSYKSISFSYREVF